MAGESRSPPYGKLRVIDKIGYGFGDFASNLFWQMFSIFLAKYYTDVFLLGASTMGTMMLVTRSADAAIDPLIGTIADRTHTRWGHFRPYLLWMSLPMAITAILTFTTPSFGGGAKVVYAYVTLSLMMIAYSAINIPYSALLGVLTPDSTDRTSVVSYRFVLAFLPVFIIVNATIPLATWLGGSANSPRGWQGAMVIFAAIAVVFYWLTFAMTRERVQPTRQTEGTLRNDLRDLFSNRPWVVLCVVGVAALTYGNIRNTVLVYYFDYVVPNGSGHFGGVMTTGAVAFIVGVALTSPLSKRFGKRNFYMLSTAAAALLTFGFYFIPPGNLPLVWAGNALISLFAAPTAPLVWAMYADTADYSEWKSGRRATGLVFSAASFAQKFGWAIGGGGAGWLLGYFGYLPNVAQGPRTVHGILLMTSIIPAAIALLALFALYFYEIDEPTVERMSAELKARRGEVAPARESTVDPDATPRSGASPRAPGAARRTAPVSGGLAVQLAADWPGLVERYRNTLDAGIHGLCFSPYVATQSPGDAIDEAQIGERLRIIAPSTGWIRSFSTTRGLERTAPLAHTLGLRTLVGAWLGRDERANEQEIAGLVEVARAGHADLVTVGNEVLLRGDLPIERLLEHIARVRRDLPGVPIGYVDAYFLFEERPQLVAACDVIIANCYPFWEGVPIDDAIAELQAMHARARRSAGGKPVIIGETGWPHAGSPVQGAQPSPAAALHYFVESCRWARESGVELFYFSAFDEPWKSTGEGEVGAHWGLWDAAGRAKYR
ncbi:MAG: glycoside-pentoside-hexuronide (GPH):cation symporter [Gammaproteobacteria bacterium]|nr:glycoside-pentoside-hexuronide (GPH):cation symporter [Gammaproteobacteria bacterium]